MGPLTRWFSRHPAGPVREQIPRPDVTSLPFVVDRFATDFDGDPAWVFAMKRGV